MGQLTKVASIGDVASGQAIAVEAEGQRIAIFNANGEFHAIGDTCTHRGGPLSQGKMEGTVVTCPWHGARYDIRTGKVLVLLLQETFAPIESSWRAMSLRLSFDGITYI